MTIPKLYFNKGTRELQRDLFKSMYLYTSLHISCLCGIWFCESGSSFSEEKAMVGEGENKFTTIPWKQCWMSDARRESHFNDDDACLPAPHYLVRNETPLSSSASISIMPRGVSHHTQTRVDSQSSSRSRYNKLTFKAQAEHGCRDEVSIIIIHAKTEFMLLHTCSQSLCVHTFVMCIMVCLP